MKKSRIAALLMALTVGCSMPCLSAYAEDSDIFEVGNDEPFETVESDVEYSIPYDTHVSGNFEYIVSNGQATIIKYTGDQDEVVFPETVDNIPIAALSPKSGAFFKYNTRIKRVTLPEGVTKVETIFVGCTNLTTVILPSTISEISKTAFRSCTSLSYVNLPDGLTVIGDSAFIGCTSLKYLTIPEGVEEINPNTFKDCTSLETVNLPSTINNIDANAFQNCEDLVNINFPLALTNIGKSAFQGCSSLKAAHLPNNITTIGKAAFQNCKSLCDVHLPRRLGVLDDSFQGCTNLRSLVVSPETTQVSGTVSNNGRTMLIYPTSADIKGSYDKVGAMICYLISDGNAVITGVKTDLNTISLPDNIFEYPIAGFTEQFDGIIEHTHFPSEAMCNICNHVRPPVARFVERLYRVILNRDPDPEGYINHVTNLNRGRSACDVAYDFIFADEFVNGGLSNDEVVRRLYKVFLDRDPDNAGFENWKKVLDSGCSYGALMYGFSQSAEFSRICESYGINRGNYSVTENRDKSPSLTAFVNRLYNKILVRNGEPEGLNSHIGAYLQDRDINKLAYNFIFSQEFIDRNLSNEDYVELLYQTFFDRASDAPGKATWVGKLNEGASRYEVMLGFTGSPECATLIASFGI